MACKVTDAEDEDKWVNVSTSLRGLSYTMPSPKPIGSSYMYRVRGCVGTEQFCGDWSNTLHGGDHSLGCARGLYKR